jgi:uncharacterized protein (TIGR02996 family)
MNLEDERRALLRGILEQPDDDTARLVFADWLEEKGGEPKWAQFIRCQIEIARRDQTCLFTPLQVRSDAFRVSFDEIADCKPWIKWPPIIDRSWPLVVVLGGPRNYAQCVGWHRGFPAIVGCTERKWHQFHYCFEGPIEALCLRNSSGSWGCYQHEDGQWRYRSMINRQIPEVTGEKNGGRVIAAFPNVRRVFGPCSAAILREFCTGRLTEILPQSYELEGAST